ncbi:MAG: DUF1007 family protein [Rhizobiaceae bacterium]|jgi:ABC-type uncharacterized transport system substrate-binding protein|nr:DUF1007 family protein [Rhizobiaceae bacterium]
MIHFKRLLAMLAMTGPSLLVSGIPANAHPHVFVETSMEIVRNDKGEFSELRQVWRFDELFSSTLVLDFDANGNGELDPDEIEEITTTVKKSIADYDFYTAMRAGEKVIEFYEPDALKGYMEGGQMIMFLAVEPAKPYSFDDGPLRISASDTSYYVAFNMDEANIKLVGPDAEACNTTVVHPDFDKLYAENADTLSEAFFNEQEGVTDLKLGDQFYSWANISCS